MITLEAQCKLGRYLAVVVPMMDKRYHTEYCVLVFRGGQEVYEETEKSLEDAMETAKAYMDWRTELDFDS
jgi:hypothetical protein